MGGPPIAMTNQGSAAMMKHQVPINLSRRDSLGSAIPDAPAIMSNGAAVSRGNSQGRRLIVPQSESTLHTDANLRTVSAN